MTKNNKYLDMKKLENMQAINIMPRKTDLENLKSYFKNFEKENNCNLKFNEKESSIIFNKTKIYFFDYKDIMCYLEGVKEGVFYGSKNRQKLSYSDTQKDNGNHKC